MIVCACDIALLSHFVVFERSEKSFLQIKEMFGLCINEARERDKAKRKGQ